MKCSKTFQLTIDPGDCYGPGVPIAGSANQATAFYGSSALVPDGAYTTSNTARLYHYNLATIALLGFSAMPAYGNPQASGGAFCTGNNSFYMAFSDLLLFWASGYIRWDGDTLLELAYINAGTLGGIGSPLYIAAKNAIYAARVIAPNKFINVLNCLTDTMADTLASADPDDNQGQVAYRPSTDRIYIPYRHTTNVALNRICEYNANTLVLTNTLAAGTLNNYATQGLVYCPTNDRLYLWGLHTGLVQNHVLCINPGTGAIEATVVCPGGFVGFLNLNYDVAEDLVFCPGSNVSGIDPATNTIVCPYGPFADTILQVATGGGHLIVPQNVASTLIIHS